MHSTLYTISPFPVPEKYQFGDGDIKWEDRPLIDDYSLLKGDKEAERLNELSQLLPDALFSPEDSRTFTYKGGWEQLKREHDEKISKITDQIKNDKTLDEDYRKFLLDEIIGGLHSSLFCIYPNSHISTLNNLIYFCGIMMEPGEKLYVNKVFDFHY